MGLSALVGEEDFAGEDSVLVVSSLLGMVEPQSFKGDVIEDGVDMGAREVAKFC